MENFTTIQISSATREKLAKLRRYKRETYDELLNSLLALVPTGDEEGEYSDEFRAAWLRSLEDIRAGRVYSEKDAKRLLGL